MEPTSRHQDPPSGWFTVGVDIGGTKVLGGVVDSDGLVLDRLLMETPDRSLAPAVVEETVISVVQRLLGAHDVRGLGLGVAGFVGGDGSVFFAPHLPWRGEPLRGVLADRLGLPVVVDNDANTAARAEMKFGAGRGTEQALCVTLGTGIGGAVVLGGRVVRGINGFAGEFGHMQVVPDGRSCECGQTGCWEQYCSGRALARAVAGDHTGSGPEITAAAAAGQAWGLRAFEEVGGWLGVGLAGLVSAFDPEVVIIGGGLSDAGDLLLEPARRAFAARLPGTGHRALPPIVQAELGPDAGFIGAADLARELVEGSLPEPPTSYLRGRANDRCGASAGRDELQRSRRSARQLATASGAAVRLRRSTRE